MQGAQKQLPAAADLVPAYRRGQFLLRLARRFRYFQQLGLLELYSRSTLLAVGIPVRWLRLDGRDEAGRHEAGAVCLAVSTQVVSA